MPTDHDALVAAINGLARELDAHIEPTSAYMRLDMLTPDGHAVHVYLAFHPGLRDVLDAALAEAVEGKATVRAVGALAPHQA